MENKQLPEVCVVMPVYNGAKTIELAIKSLLYQTYPNWNCVIVNDGSTDKTKEILDKIKDIRFKIINLDQNKGRGYARQICLENASGDLLTYLDADDFYHPEKIRNQVNIFEHNINVKLVACGQGSFDNKLNIKSIRGIRNFGYHNFRNGDKINFVPVTSMIKLKRALKSSYNSKLNASEDVDYFSDYLLDNDYFISNEVHYYYYEFESISYFKVIEYAFNSLKRIYFSRAKMKQNTFIKESFVVSSKLFFYILFYFVLGKNYFINNRGLKPTEDQVVEFINSLNVLNQSSL